MSEYFLARNASRVGKRWEKENNEPLNTNRTYDKEVKKREESEEIKFFARGNIIRFNITK